MTLKKQKADFTHEKDARPLKPAWRVQLGVNWILSAACYFLFSLLDPLSLIRSCGVPNLLIKQEGKSILKSVQYQGADTLALVALLSLLGLSEFPALIGISPKDMRIKSETRALSNPLGAAKRRYLYATATAAILLLQAASIRTSDMPWRYCTYISKRDSNGHCKEMRYKNAHSVYNRQNNGFFSVQCSDEDKKQIWEGFRNWSGTYKKVRNNAVFATLDSKNGMFFEEQIDSEKNPVRKISYTKNHRIYNIIVPEVGGFFYSYENKDFFTKTLLDYKKKIMLSADFDYNNRCLRVTFPSNRVLNFHYYGDGKRSAICTDEAGRKIKGADFDVYGKITRIIDEHRRIITYEYEPSGAIKATYRLKKETENGTDIPHRVVMYDKEGRNYRTEALQTNIEYVYYPDGTVLAKDSKPYGVQICTTAFDPHGKPVERYMPLDGLKYIYSPDYKGTYCGTIKATNDEVIGVFEYDRHDSIALEALNNGTRSVFGYDQNGGCQIQTSNINTPELPALISIYNNNGSVKTSNIGGLYIQYTHNEDGSFTAKYMGREDLSARILFYNSSGLCREKHYRNTKIFYEYADNNSVIETQRKLENGAYNETEIHKYDEKRRLIESLFVGRYIETYEYKENDVIIKTVMSLDRKPLTIFFPEYYEEYSYSEDTCTVKRTYHEHGQS